MEPVNWMFAVFPDLASIDQEIRNQLQETVNVFRSQLVASKYWENLFKRFLTWIYRVLYLPFILAVPFIFAKWMDVSLPIVLSILSFLLYLLLFSLLLILTFLPIFLARRYRHLMTNTRYLFLSSRGYIWSVFAWVVESYLLYYLIVNQDFATFFLFSVSAAIFGLLGYSLILILYMILLLPIIGYITTRRKSNLTHALIVERLIASLHSVESAPSIHDPELKRSVLRNIEYIAELIQHYLFQSNKIRNIVTDTLIDDLSIRVAAGFRDIKPTIISPIDNSRQELIGQFSNLVVASIKGNWGAFPTSSYTKSGFPKLLRTKIKNLFTRLFYGFIPLIMLLGIQRISILISGNPLIEQSINNYFLSFSVLWAILNVLRLFNPDIHEEVELANKMSSIINPFGPAS